MAESVERRGGAQQWHTKYSAVQRGEGVQECSSAAVQQCRRVHNIFSEKSPDTVAAAAAGRCDEPSLL